LPSYSGLGSIRLRAQVELEARKRGITSGVETNAPFAQYADSCVRFGEEVLGQHFTDDVKTMMESVRINPVTIARSSNATGKTHGAASVVIWFYKAFPNAQIYTTAAPPEKNLRTLLWGEMGAIIEQHKEVFAGDKIIDLHISRSKKCFITGVAIPTTGSREQRQAKFSGKHAPNMLFVVDEGDAVPEEIYEAIESCMSGGNARLLILFNPRMQSGPLWRMEKQRAANVVEMTTFRHPNVVTGQDVIPGAVDREKTVRRIQQWTRPLTKDEKVDAECFEVPPFLVGYRAKALSGDYYPPLMAGPRKIVNPVFFHMVLGQYPAQNEFQLINQAWIDRARARWDAYVAKFGEVPPKAVKPIVGLDIAEFGNDSNAFCPRYGGWVAPITTWKGIDPNDTATRAAGLCATIEARQIFVDALGVGAGVPGGVKEKSRKFHSPTPLQVFGVKVSRSPNFKAQEGEFGVMRDQLWWAMREWLRTDTSAMLPPDEDLIEELIAPTYGYDKKGKIKVMDKDAMREVLKRSPDRGESLMLTFAPPINFNDDSVPPSQSLLTY
jgi:phage terminase large subunit